MREQTNLEATIDEVGFAVRRLHQHLVEQGSVLALGGYKAEAHDVIQRAYGVALAGRALGVNIDACVAGWMPRSGPASDQD